MSKLITIKELMDKLQISRASVYNYIQNKKMPFVKIGRNTRFDEQEIDEWIRKENARSEGR